MKNKSLTVYSMGGDKKWETIRQQAKEEAGKLEKQADGTINQAVDKAKSVGEEIKKKVS